MKNLTVLIAVFMLPSGALAEVQAELRVSATVPPRPCEIGQPCDSASQPVAAPQTRVIVTGEAIRYVGPTPDVIRTEDLTTILF